MIYIADKGNITWAKILKFVYFFKKIEKNMLNSNWPISYNLYKLWSTYHIDSFKIKKQEYTKSKIRLICILRKLDKIELILESISIQIQTLHMRYLETSWIVCQQTQSILYENLMLKEISKCKIVTFLSLIKSNFCTKKKKVIYNPYLYFVTLQKLVLRITKFVIWVSRCGALQDTRKLRYV